MLHQLNDKFDGVWISCGLRHRFRCGYDGFDFYDHLDIMTKMAWSQSGHIKRRLLHHSFTFLVAAVCSSSSHTIHTEPVLVENTLARNFIGFKLSIKFVSVGGSYIWSHPAFTPRQSGIFSVFVSCANRSEINFQVTCQNVSCESSYEIISSLSLMFPLNKNVRFAVIQLGTRAELASIDIKVRGKLSSI